MLNFVMFPILFFSVLCPVVNGQELFREESTSERTGQNLVDQEFLNNKRRFDELKAKDASDFVGTGELEYQLRVGPPISNKYHRGSFLIYDCKGRYFACVREENFEECEAKRANEEKFKKIDLSCYPVRGFLTQEECFKNQTDLVHKVVNKSFCFNRK